MPADSAWVVTSGSHDPDTVGRLLRSLPGWFGIESANAGYLQSARELPTYLARPAHGPATEPVGVLLARRHFAASAEIHLLAVDPSLHRQGVGRALVEELEADLIADGCELLQVKTLGPSSPDAGYARTRQFYKGLGFQPLEELQGLWGPESPCLIMIKVLIQPVPVPKSTNTIPNRFW
jgi:GNAT superfamily N-acetyltransferase